MGSSFIHLIRTDSNEFFLMAEYYSMVYMYHSFLIHCFKPTFSVSSFTFIIRLFSSSSLSAIRVVSSAYLRLLIFLPAILIPACESSSQAFHMMYSAYKLKKQGNNIEPWCTPFQFGKSQSVVPCPVLTIASWPTYRFLRRQVRWSGIHISFRIFHTGGSKYPLPTTQEITLHMDITRWSIPKSDWLYSLQLKMEKLYTVSKHKNRSWLWLRSWTPCCQIQALIEESRENH